MRAALLASCAFALAPRSALAVDWTGAASSDWFASGNWSGGAAPNAGTDVVVDNAGAAPQPVIGTPGAAAQNLAVGSTGTGTLLVENGGTLNARLTIGADAGSNGTVTATGAGTAITGRLVLGSDGTGTFNILSGASFTHTGMVGIVGFGSTGVGALTVSGAGSSLTTLNEFAFGWSGRGSLVLSDGAQYNSSGGATFGAFSNSAGSGLVTGTGTVLNTTQALAVGGGGTGTFTIADGGTVNSASGRIADSANGRGLVTVTGPNAQWNNTGNLYVGDSGTGALTISNGGLVSVGGALSIADAVGAVGSLNIGAAAGQAAAAAGTLNAAALSFGAGDGRVVFNHTNAAYSFGTAMSGNGAVDVRAGTTTLTATSTYTGPTTVYGGTLLVDGSIASSDTFVNTGGVLGGGGTVGNTTVSGGTLSPGNSIGTLTVQGNLGFTPTGTYRVEVSGVTSDRTDVTAAASLAGTVRVSSLTGTYLFNTPYTILTAATLNGSRFGGVTVVDGISGVLTYTNNTVTLSLASGLGSMAGGSANQGAVGSVLDPPVNAQGSSGGSLGVIFNGDVRNNLDQLAGQTATGSQQATFGAMNQFIGVMTDPFVSGQDNAEPFESASSFAGGASAYAATRSSVAEREAYAMLAHTPRAAMFEQRWSVWATGFGGTQTTDGNASLGSATTTSRIGGVAAGATYRIAIDLVAGFALAGGGGSFGLNNGLGSGRSDLFQAGGFLRQSFGPAYLSGALAYGWQDITTDRTVTVGGTEQLRANFKANAFSGRLEGGYRYDTPRHGVGVTPYAAAQFTSLALPAYAEQVVSGPGTFALGYASNTVTASRSELGLRTDKSFAVRDGIVTLRGRAAWAHDFNTERAATATFQTLPAASFVVNGAAPAANAVLTSASAEMKWRNGIALAATFDAEFSDTTRSYAGKGSVRYAW